MPRNGASNPVHSTGADGQADADQRPRTGIGIIGTGMAGIATVITIVVVTGLIDHGDDDHHHHHPRRLVVCFLVCPHVKDILARIDERNRDPGGTRAHRHAPCQSLGDSGARHDRELPPPFDGGRRKRQPHGLA